MTGKEKTLLQGLSKEYRLSAKYGYRQKALTFAVQQEEYVSAIETALKEVEALEAVRKITRAYADEDLYAAAADRVRLMSIVDVVGEPPQ